MPAHRDLKDGGFDGGGLLLLAGVLVLVNVYLARAPSAGWLSPLSLALLAATLVCLVLFLRRERGLVRPLVRLGLFRNITFTGAVLANFLVSGVLGAATLIGMNVLQEGAGWSSFQAGLVTIGFLVAVVATIRTGERRMQSIGSRVPMLAALSLTGAGALLLGLTLLGLVAYTVVAVVGFTLIGVGLGLFATPATDTALSNVPESAAGQAAGIFKMAASLGNAIIVALVAAVYTLAKDVDPAWLRGSGLVDASWGSGGDGIAVRAAATIAFAVTILLAMIGLLLVVRLMSDAMAEGRHRATRELRRKQRIARDERLGRMAALRRRRRERVRALRAQGRWRDR